MADPNALTYVAAQLKPVPGKVDEILAGLAEMAAAVEANEPGALAYQYFYNEADDEIAILEIYVNEAAYENHKNAEYTKAAVGARAEGLFAAAPKIQVIKRKGGFRRN